MEEETNHTIVEERETLMVPPTNEGLPTLKKAHFLKPIYNNPNPTNQLLPNSPFLCIPSNSNTKKLIKKKVDFKGRLKHHNSWKIWVENLQKTHELSWKRVGIYDAIKGSTYRIKEDDELIIGLAEKWCPETNTFVFPWGEATITLEDVMILGGFSVFGFSVLENQASASITDDQEILKNKLNDACANIKKDSTISHVSHREWMNYFKGCGGELENVALIVMWLSMYVSPSFNFNNAFEIAVSLARGVKIALAPAVLALIYRDLSLLKEKIVSLNCDEGQVDASKLGLWAPFQLVQVWAWERFMSLRPKPETLVDGEPRLARWHGVKGVRVRNLRLEIESAGGEFLWRPYALSVRNWEFPKFYCDEELWVLVDSEVDEELLSFARCLRVCELVGVDCLEQYLPHRVAMQFGFDQDIPISIPRSNADTELAWSSYEKPLHGLKFYLPPRLLEGDVTIQYSNWWKTLDFLPVEQPIQGRRKIKVKKLSQLLHESKEGNCKEAVELDCFGNGKEIPNEKLTSSVETKDVQDIVIDLLLRPEDSGNNVSNAVEEVREKEVYQNEIPICSTSQCKEEMCADFGGSRSNRPNDRSTCSEDRNYCEGACSSGEKSIKYDETCRGGRVLINTETTSSLCGALADDVQHTSAVDADTKLINTETTSPLCGALADDIQHTSAVDADTKLINTETTSPLCGALADDVQHTDTKLMKKTSSDDIIVVSDDDMDADIKWFEARCLEFDARLNQLDKIVSALKEAKERSKVG